MDNILIEYPQGSYCALEVNEYTLKPMQAIGYAQLLNWCSMQGNDPERNTRIIEKYNLQAHLKFIKLKTNETAEKKIESFWSDFFGGTTNSTGPR